MDAKQQEAILANANTIVCPDCGGQGRVAVTKSHQYLRSLDFPNRAARRWAQRHDSSAKVIGWAKCHKCEGTGLRKKLDGSIKIG